MACLILGTTAGQLTTTICFFVLTQPSICRGLLPYSPFVSSFGQRCQFPFVTNHRLYQARTPTNHLHDAVYGIQGNLCVQVQSTPRGETREAVRHTLCRGICRDNRVSFQQLFGQSRDFYFRIYAELFVLSKFAAAFSTLGGGVASQLSTGILDHD